MDAGHVAGNQCANTCHGKAACEKSSWEVLQLSIRRVLEPWTQPLSQVNTETWRLCWQMRGRWWWQLSHSLSTNLTCFGKLSSRFGGGSRISRASQMLSLTEDTACSWWMLKLNWDFILCETKPSWSFFIYVYVYNICNLCVYIYMYIYIYIWIYGFASGSLVLNHVGILSSSSTLKAARAWRVRTCVKDGDRSW